jgi:hypothetical protein
MPGGREAVPDTIGLVKVDLSSPDRLRLAVDRHFAAFEIFGQWSIFRKHGEAAAHSKLKPPVSSSGKSE